MNGISLAIGDFINLSHNTKLCSLHILVLDLQDHMMIWVPSILSQVSSAQFERVLFDVSLFSAGQLDNEYWLQIGQTLAHPRYSPLKQVKFFNRGVMSFESAYLALHAALTALSNRQLLVLDDCTSTTQ